MTGKDFPILEKYNLTIKGDLCITACELWMGRRRIALGLARWEGVERFNPNIAKRLAFAAACRQVVNTVFTVTVEDNMNNPDTELSSEIKEAQSDDL